MIDLNSLENKDIRRLVVYTDGVGNREEGTLTSWNDRFIFVDYGNTCGRGIATDPKDLDWTINL